MVSEREGWHNLNTQVPDELWHALLAESDQTGDSIATIITRRLWRSYKIPTHIPKPKRRGRKPKKP